MADIFEPLGKSLLYHGKLSDRVYIMKACAQDGAALLSYADELAKKYDYGKIFAKIPACLEETFKNEGYYEEAKIPDFYGKETAFFMSKYLKPERAKLSNAKHLEEVLKVAKAKTQTAFKEPLPKGFCIKALGPQEANILSELYAQVFESYPFDIFNPQYIKKTMGENIDYFGIFDAGGILVSASSLEKDLTSQSAEVTDFATHPKATGQNLACHLMTYMQIPAKKQGIKTLFSIARATIFPVNITLAKCGYSYAGTLKNNTGIGGTIESMTVWYKKSPL